MATRVSTKLIVPSHPTLNLTHPTIEPFTWNNLIRAAQNLSQSLSQNKPTSFIRTPSAIFTRMCLHSVKPDFYTFPYLLQCFSNHTHLWHGQKAHAQVMRYGLHLDLFAETSLINMYSACGELDSARRVFDEMPEQDLPSWNSIISAHVQVGQVSIARRLFDAMPQRNVISWSCMINGHVRWGQFMEALDLFTEMHRDGAVVPNGYTMSSVISACGGSGSLDLGKRVHAYINWMRIEISVVLGTALIDMYAKCGDIERARWIFNSLDDDNKDVMVWSAMISGLAMHGDGVESIGLFQNMLSSGVRPNDTTFLGVLCACAYCGLVDEGEKYFKMMSDEFSISPSIRHYGCLVDLYGRAGLMDKVWDTIGSMPMEPDVLIWGALLSASRRQRNVTTCEFALKKLIELEPTNTGAHVLLSNLYAKTGRWEDVRMVRELMEAKSVKKVPGCSMIEVGGICYKFFAGDNSDLETYMALEEIMKRLKKEGFVSKSDQVLLDLDEEAKELALVFHSEKLAVAFALLKTSPDTVIRVIKNLTICCDCHAAMKIISRLYEREIIIRDCSRFHHFRFGTCSCRDYW